MAEPKELHFSSAARIYPEPQFFVIQPQLEQSCPFAVGFGVHSEVLTFVQNMAASTHLPKPIPGYQLLHLLGKGGMAEVYLAHQDSVDREVALKLMSRHLLTDPRFAERFLREARIAARLQHRHVVSIFDVGVADEQPYIAMEYLTGGQVMPRDDAPISEDQALRCVYEIALALDYAHSKGYIHRDVKPDNILLRDDGSCVLSDFGIARTVDSATMMTKTGSVVGTPFYMSPEQLRGREVDGRADLYSLGVVFYQLLTGKVPYSASDSLAIGIMHMTAPMPRLPARYSHLQKLLDRMLAKEANERVQTGKELAAMVRKFQLPGLEPEETIRTQAQNSTKKVVPVPPRIEPRLQDAGRVDQDSPTQETRISPSSSAPAALPPNPSPPISSANSKRREPHIGESELGNARRDPSFGDVRPVPRADPAFGQIDPSMDQAAWRRPVQEKRSGSSAWPWVMLLLVAILGVSYWQRDAINTQIAQWRDGGTPSDVLASARKQEAAGVLFDDTDSDALSRYEAALVAEPENASAKAGVERVLSSLLEQTQTLIASEPAAAERLLTRLERTHAQDVRVRTLRARLQPQNTPPKVPVMRSIDERLELALTAERAREWLGARGALAQYLLILREDANNARAKSGLRTAQKAALELLEQAIKSGDTSQIERLNREWEAVEPSSQERQVRMLTWRSRQNADDEKVANIALWLQQAQSALGSGQLVSPKGQSAVDLYKQVLQADPTNATAKAGLAKVQQALLDQAENAIQAGRLEMADKLLQQARQQGAASRLIARLNDQLENKRRATEASQVQPLNEAEAQVRAGIMEQIDAALAQDRLLDPPGSNAFDLLRKAQRSGPGPDITERLERLSAALKVRLNEGVESSDFEAAANVLSALQSLGPDRSLNATKLRLSESVVSDIRAKLGMGAVDAAERRLSLLKQLDRNHPELQELQVELLAAKGDQ